MLDILELMESVKEMLEVLNVELENVKMEHLQLMLIVLNTNQDAKQQEKDVLPLWVHAQAIKEHRQPVLVILDQMVIAKEQVQQLQEPALQSFVKMLQQQQLQIQHALPSKQDVGQLDRDVSKH